MIASTSFNRVQTRGVHTIYWDEKGPGRMLEIAFVTPEVAKRDKERSGTGNNCRLEEYISRIESMIKEWLTPRKVVE